MTEQDAIVDLLKDIRKWIRASSYPNVLAMLKEILKDDRSRLIYQLTDGTRGRDQIKEIVKVGSSTVTDLWDSCVSMGLMEVAGNRRTRVFDLRDFRLVTSEQIESATSSLELSDKAKQAK